MSTWMVVEDEPDIYEVLLAMFEMWGIEGVAFVDGEEAVAWIDDVDNSRFQGELPELALLDIRLPGEINGVMVGERLRQSPILGQVAMVLTSAYVLNVEEQAEAMGHAGADLWLPKPLPHFNELQGILEKVIAERRVQRNAAVAAAATVSSESTESPEPEEVEVVEETKTKKPAKTEKRAKIDKIEINKTEIDTKDEKSSE